MPVAGRGGEGRLEVMGATSPAKWGLPQILGMEGNQNNYQKEKRKRGKEEKRKRGNE